MKLVYLITALLVLGIHLAASILTHKGMALGRKGEEACSKPLHAYLEWAFIHALGNGA
jgi:hypothetical protein